MTAKEMFENKYRAYMQNITPRAWEKCQAYAEAKKMPVYKFIMLNLQITVNECNPRQNAEVYWELIQMNNDKLIASNRHKQYSGHVTTFWLTPKGYKKLFE
jgi:hypothetical protein